jgi:hypothetical protein
MDDRLSELKIKIKIKDGLARFYLPSSTVIVTSLVELRSFLFSSITLLSVKKPGSLG